MANPNPDQSGMVNFKDMTPEERREIAKKGAIACNEKKRARKSMREMLDYLLQKDIQTKDGQTMQTQEAILISTIRKAISGNMNAVSFIRDTIGEKPVDKVQFTPTEESIKEVEKLIEDGK